MVGKTMIYLGSATVLVAFAYFGWKLTARGAYESAEYTVLEAASPFEVREYADLMMATTNAQLASQGADGGA